MPIDHLLGVNDDIDNSPGTIDECMCMSPISGAMLQEHARKSALQTGDTDFKASNGFQARHKVSSTTLSGERASIYGATDCTINHGLR